MASTHDNGECGQRHLEQSYTKKCQNSHLPQIPSKMSIASDLSLWLNYRLQRSIHELVRLKSSRIDRSIVMYCYWWLWRKGNIYDISFWKNQKIRSELQSGGSVTRKVWRYGNMDRKLAIGVFEVLCIQRSVSRPDFRLTLVAQFRRF